jgi:hypothetical protein
MQELRNFLRSPLTDSNGPSLDAFCTSVDGRYITVRAVFDERDAGMRLARSGLEWKLQPELAEAFAHKVHQLTSAGDGHQYLDARGNEVAVEVSIGEYPEALNPIGSSMC